MAKKKTIAQYRDSKTGRFVDKSTWKRSRAHGGIRYKRERKRARKRAVPPVRPRALPTPEEIEREIEREKEEEEIEYAGAFDSP